MTIYLSAHDNVRLKQAQVKLKESWLAPLFELFTDYDITVAGGAIRDTIFDKPVADIDVFYVDEIPEFIQFELSVEEVGEPYGNTSFSVTHEGEYQHKKVQFIKVNGTFSHELIDTFPCNISKVFVKNNTLWFISDFISSFDNKIIWKVGADKKYKAKIKDKYPEMIHVTKEHFDLNAALGSFVNDSKNAAGVKPKRYRILNSTSECYREFTL